MPVSSRVRTSSGAAEARTDIRASSASCASVSSCAARIVAYCAASRDPNSSGSSAPESHGGAGLQQRRQGHRRQVAVDPERDVGDRAHLQRDAGVDDPGAAGRGPRRSGRRGRAGCACRSSRQTRTCSGPRSSPPCGTSSSPARSAIRNAGAKSAVLPRRSSLDRPKPTTPRPAYCAASRARVRASSGCRVRFAAITTAIPTPVAADGVPHRVQDQVGERGDPAEPARVAARVDLDLQPAAAVPGVVLGRLADQATDVVLGAQHRAGDVVEALEAEPALLVGRAQLGRPLGDQRVRQRDPVALGELEQRRVPHRAGEVEVQMCLREGTQVPAVRSLGTESGGAFGGPTVTCVDCLFGGFPTCFAMPRGPDDWIGNPSKGTSSTGRASVSKTEGWGFKSLVPCRSTIDTTTTSTRRTKVRGVTDSKAVRGPRDNSRDKTPRDAPASRRSTDRWSPSCARSCGRRRSSWSPTSPWSWSSCW